MAEPEKNFLQKVIDSCSGWKASYELLRDRFGRPIAAGLVALAALIGISSYFWSNWKDIKERPGVPQVVAYLSQKPVSPVQAGRLTIAVAHLDDDKDREQEKLLLEELPHFEGVDTLAVDRLVEWPALGTEQLKEKKAEEDARGLLNKTRADVLIWGKVITLGGKSAMRLYWTLSREVSGAAATGKYLPQTETFALPEAFWNDLKQILGLLTQTRLEELTFGQEGHYVADRLKPLIDQVRALIESKQGVWNPETLAGVRFNLATALRIYGEQSGENEALNESIKLYRQVLDQWTRERAPLRWAMTRMTLGTALGALGKRESGTARLEEAAAFRAALEESPRERAPLQWAMTQMNLGNALYLLGTRESGAARLEEAVTAYREALKEQTRERVPLHWAMTQYNLGLALGALGERESGTVLLEEGITIRVERESGSGTARLETARLEEGITALREALKERTRERVPLKWAMTQADLGTALARLGEREGGTARLEEAIAAYREGLKEFTRERVPLDWAKTQMNLGAALKALGEQESGTAPFERLEEAVAAWRDALRELSRERTPLDWAKTQMNLGLALLNLGARESSGTARVEEAVDAFREVLKEFDQKTYYGQETQEYLNEALALLTERKRKLGP